jgi:hypothetical protein
MNITTLVDTALDLREKIEALTKALGIIEEELRGTALKGEQILLEDPDLEGRQYLAQGTNKVLPVIFTSDFIIQSFGDKSKAHVELAKIAGDQLPTLYRAKTTYEIVPKTGKQFRSAAAAQLGDKAPQFITAAISRDKYGIARSQIKIAYDRATPLG